MGEGPAAPLCLVAVHWTVRVVVWNVPFIQVSENVPFRCHVVRGVTRSQEIRLSDTWRFDSSVAAPFGLT